jgi:hypothetical protein
LTKILSSATQTTTTPGSAFKPTTISSLTTFVNTLPVKPSEASQTTTAFKSITTTITASTTQALLTRDYGIVIYVMFLQFQNELTLYFG